MSLVGYESGLKQREKEILGQIEQDIKRKGFDSHTFPPGEITFSVRE